MISPCRFTNVSYCSHTKRIAVGAKNGGVGFYELKPGKPCQVCCPQCVPNWCTCVYTMIHVSYHAMLGSVPCWTGNIQKPVLIDHCHERPPVWQDHIFPAEAPTHFTVSIDHLSWDSIFMANGVVFQERFYCTILSHCKGCENHDGFAM